MHAQLQQRIDRLHAHGLVDMHFDLPLDLYDRRTLQDILASEYLPEHRSGGMGVLGVAIYLEDKHLPEMALRVALDQVARLYAEIDHTPEYVLARSYADIAAARAAGKIALLLTMEGVEPIGTDLDLLRVFYELGLRSVGLTHVRRNAAGDGGQFAASGSSPAGLSAFGKKVVAECERLGMLLDLAHLNPAGVDDVLRLAQRPVIISHTNPRRYNDIERNSSDAHIREVGRRGGVIGINAVLLTQKPEEASIDLYVEQVEYVAELAGIDSVGIGFDFIEFLYRHWTVEQQEALNAALTPPAHAPGLTNHAHARNLTARLIARGWGDEEIAKVLYGNWMRVFKELL